MFVLQGVEQLHRRVTEGVRKEDGESSSRCGAVDAGSVSSGTARLRSRVLRSRTGQGSAVTGHLQLRPQAPQQQATAPSP